VGLFIGIIYHYANAVLPFAQSPTSISSGVASCTVGNGTVYCWGYNNYGQLGDGTTNNSSVPLDVGGLLAGKNVSMVSNGYYHTCAIADNAVYCWGTGAAGRLGDNAITDSHVPVAVVDSNGLFSGKTITKVSASSLGSHTCAIAGGLASCWGLNGNGQIGNNSTSEVHVPTAVDTTGVLAGKTVTDISAGQLDTCAVASGAAYCWGSNSNGQLGNNSTTDSHVPVAVDTSGVLAGKTVTAISASSTHTCAIASGAAYCWGAGANGRLGNNSTTDSYVPVAVDTSGVLAGQTITAIAVGGSTTCVIAGGADYCWGLNSNGQLGNNSTASSLVPAAVNTSGVLSGQTVTVISGGSSTNCAIASGRAYCWGKNNYGQLGNNTVTTQSNVPVLVSMQEPAAYENIYRVYNNADSSAPGSVLADTNQAAQLVNTGDAFRVRAGIMARPDAVNITAISLGKQQGCAIASGLVYCTGQNTAGEVGNGTTTSSTIFGPVSTNTGLAGKTVTAISVNTLASYPYSCAVASGAAYCWGSNNYVALGTGQNSTVLPNSTTPVAVDTSGVLAGKTVTAITTGDGHACAIASGAAYCWGAGGNGRLGNGTSTSSSSPVAVSTSGVLAGKTVTAISASSGTTCAVASGAAYCWGYNTNGTLGNNSTTDSNVPVAVDTSGVLAGKTVTSIAVSNNTACVIANGGVYCWGAGAFGVLGNGSTTDSLVPVAVDTSGVLAGKTITKLTVTTGSACALSTEGYTYCWGSAGSGALGNGTTSGTYTTPQAVIYSGVLAGKGPTDISIGGSQNTCLIVSGSAYCWGYNATGALSIGSNTNTTVPATVTTTNVTPGGGTHIQASSTTYVLQYAKKTTATCNVQSGFTNVTTTSAIAWNTNPSVPDHTQIYYTQADPAWNSTIVYETYSSSSGSTIATTIQPGMTGLWDFSLRDNSNSFKTSYCLRMAQADGTGFDAYSTYPEIRTAPGDLSLAVVDGSGHPIANPSFSLSDTVAKITCQTTTGYLGTSSQQFRVTNNIATNGWSLSIAATAGATALWNSADNTQHYDYNDSSGSPAGCNSGSDGDGFAGQLTVDASQGSITYQSGGTCANPGVSFGTDAAFNQGTVDAITLMTASSSASMYCYFEREGINLSQTIPASQPPGNYTLDLTATVVAQ